MLTERTMLTILLVIGLSVWVGGCSAGPPVDQQVAGTETLVLHVDGMTWAGCALAVRQALTGLDGVVAAEVSFDESRAVVRYRPEVTSAAAMITAIEDIGFQARRADEPDAARRP